MIFPKANKKNQVVQLPVDRILPNPHQPRTVFDQEDLDRLAQSIEQNGLLQPISVRDIGEECYELISGERRLRACRQLGQNKIKAIVYDMGAQQSALFAMIENIQRADLSFFDQARGIAELMENQKIKQEEAAVRLGMAQSTLANKLRILRLPPEVQQAVVNKGLTERHARALLKLKTPEQQLKAVEAISQRRLNVAQADQYIESLLRGEPEQRRRILVVKDLRIFINTIDRAIHTMKQAGIEAEVGQSDHNDYIEYTVKIPKKSVYQNRDKQKEDTTLLKVSI